MAIKVYYFDFPGRAESLRLILTVGGVPFEDVRMTREQWQEIKPSTPFGQVPAMEVNGQWIAETLALERYAAAVAGLLPADPFKTANAEQALFLNNDAFLLFAPTFTLVPEAKLAARQELLKGAFGAKLGQISNLLEGKTFLLGDELCYVDLSLFCFMCIMKMDGMPPTFLDDYPGLKAHQAAVASVEKVKEHYSGKTGLYTAFQPEA